MGDGRNGGWEADSLYSEEQVDAVLTSVGQEPAESEMTHFRLYCPFHGNTDSPTLRVDKESGLFHCHNPSCAASGSLLDFVMRTAKLGPFPAARLIAKCKTSNALTFEQRLAREAAEEVEYEPFPVEVLTKGYESFWDTPKAIDYMRNRKFEDETLKHFRIGYSELRDSIMVPMHSPEGVPIGIVGRSLEGKEFKNSKGLPKSKTAWNFHRAKREGDTVIVCEASFDAMRIHQAGYRNVVALLGGSFSPTQQRQIARSFNSVVIMTDYDDPKKHMYKQCQQCKKEGSNLCKGHNPGEMLGKKVAFAMKDKRVLWAHNGGLTRFPEGIKDAGDMSDQQIRHCISNAVSNLEYAIDL